MQAWTGARMIGEAASHTGSTDPDKLVSFMKGPEFGIAAYKGQLLTLRDWDLQLRQPILLADGRTVVFDFASARLPPSNKRTRYARR